MTNNSSNEPGITLEQLKAAFAMRADAYAHLFDVLREEFDTQRAVELIAKATTRLGRGMGEKYSHLGPDNLSGLKDAFLSGIPCAADMFAPEVVRCDDERLEIQFHRCPLKDHWVEQGRSDEDIEHLCKAAAAIDGGLFSSAGLRSRGRPGSAATPVVVCLRLNLGPVANPSTTDSWNIRGWEYCYVGYSLSAVSRYRKSQNSAPSINVCLRVSSIFLL